MTQPDAIPDTELDAGLLEAALHRLQEGVLVYRGREFVYANPAARDMCRSHPLWSDEDRRLEDLIPPHALPHLRDHGRWSDYVPFGEGRMLAARLHLVDDSGHLLLLLQNPGLVKDGDKELLQRHEELNVRLTAAQEKLLESEKLASIGQLAAGVGTRHRPGVAQQDHRQQNGKQRIPDTAHQLHTIAGLPVVLKNNRIHAFKKRRFIFQYLRDIRLKFCRRDLRIISYLFKKSCAPLEQGVVIPFVFFK